MSAFSGTLTYVEVRSRQFFRVQILLLLLLVGFTFEDRGVRQPQAPLSPHLPVLHDTKPSYRSHFPGRCGYRGVTPLAPPSPHLPVHAIGNKNKTYFYKKCGVSFSRIPYSKGRSFTIWKASNKTSLEPIYVLFFERSHGTRQKMFLEMLFGCERRSGQIQAR